MNTFRLFVFLIFVSGFLSAQESKLVEINNHPERIKSIQLYVKGFALSFPVSNIDGTIPLMLHFDDMYGDVSDFSYTILHCDKDWYPTDIDRSYYAEGFDRVTIRDFRYSVTSRSDFTHYSLQLPNEEVKWLWSGNYVLQVFDEDSDDEEPLFTRRFVVLDSKADVTLEQVRAIGVNTYDTHQELDIKMTPHKGVSFDRPHQELFTTVIQNYRWDKTISDILPNVVRSGEIYFDYQGLISFPAGKEFRLLDLRSINGPKGRVTDVVLTQNDITALLRPDKPQAYKIYSFTNDHNGKFVIVNDNFQNKTYTASDDTEREIFERQIRSEYVRCIFSLLYTQSLEDQDVYIVGAFNDWRPNDASKMIYDDEHHAYIKEILLKQGFYDYTYMAVPRQEDMLAENIDGDWYETDNAYTVLVYYRPVGSRYDQLVAIAAYSSLGD